MSSRMVSARPQCLPALARTIALPCSVTGLFGFAPLAGLATAVVGLVPLRMGFSVFCPPVRRQTTFYQSLAGLAEITSLNEYQVSAGTPWKSLGSRSME